MEDRWESDSELPFRLGFGSLDRGDGNEEANDA